MNIGDIAELPQLASLRALDEKAAGADATTGKGDFGSLLKSSIAQVNSLQQQADTAITALASGERASLHDTMIAMEKADISFRLMMQVRNKIVDAYQEIMRMQV